MTIKSSNSALQGFRSIYHKRVNAVAIVCEKGSLIGTLSASDVRTITAHNASDVLLPVLKFLVRSSFSILTAFLRVA
jgi:hypothetical protein